MWFLVLVASFCLSFEANLRSAYLDAAMDLRDASLDLDDVR